MRMSSNQSKALVVLYFMKEKGVNHLENKKLMNIVENANSCEIRPEHFRRSCHRLVSEGYLILLRSKSLKIAWSLTESGIKKAIEINKKMNG